MKRSCFTFLILVFVLFPSTASANAGTPLMWASMLHLLVGNAILGLIEGLTLAWLFGCSKRKSIRILIIANYASAWAGGFLVAGYLPSLADITVENLRTWFLIFLCVAFVVTVLVEFVFFWFALPSTEHRLRRTLAATITVNGISYVLLFGWYWIASGTSMMTQLEVVSVDEMDLQEPYALYYLSRRGDEIIRMDLTSPTSKETISRADAHHRDDRLFARARRDSGFDLFVYHDSGDREAESESRILENFSEQAPVDWRIAEGHSDKPVGSGRNFGSVPAIGPASDWRFLMGFWPANGIRGYNDTTGEILHYSLELPFTAWRVRNATQIAGDHVVAQLGEDQICLMNLPSGKIALIARGKGPIVAKPKISNNPAGSSAIIVEQEPIQKHP